MIFYLIVQKWIFVLFLRHMKLEYYFLNRNYICIFQNFFILQIIYLFKYGLKKVFKLKPFSKLINKKRFI